MKMKDICEKLGTYYDKLSKLYEGFDTQPAEEDRFQFASGSSSTDVATRPRFETVHEHAENEGMMEYTTVPRGTITARPPAEEWSASESDEDKRDIYTLSAAEGGKKVHWDQSDNKTSAYSDARGAAARVTV